jgi:mono/diheme cytochrome c family protein
MVRPGSGQGFVARATAISLSLGALALAFACKAAPQGKPDIVAGEEPRPGAATSATERGQYLVAVAGCNDCHTPLKMGPNGPEPDLALQLSGHPAALKATTAPALPEPWVLAGTGTNTAFAGPWGISYAINLTPDEETGIGLWSEQVFVNALKTGRHMGVGRPILPPMPWTGYAKMTDEDLKAVYAYLRTLQPRKNQVPEAVLAPPPGAAPAGAKGE